MGKKSKTGKGRLDKYYHLAKEQGYRSRAAFKLVQLNKKFNFLEKAKVLIDLCAAPGGWLQIASKYMPTQSIIVGVDLVPIKPIPRCITFAEDITTDKCRAQLRGALKTWKADVVLHDGAPNVGTAWVQDAYSQSELVLHSLKLATEFLTLGGWFVTKVFRSKDYNALVWVFNELFDSVEATKPPSSRAVSAEIFVVCKGFKAPKKIDPKFLDPRHVFKDLEEKAVTSITSVFQPDKKKRNREGYAEGERILYHTATVETFVTSDDPVGLLASNNALEFTDETPEAAALSTHALSTVEIKACFADLKVLGKKDFKSLLKWRLAVRTERGLEEDKDAVEAARKAAAEAADAAMTDEERMARELERAAHDDASRTKRAKRKVGEKRAKELLRMTMGMATPTDLGTEMVADDQLFAPGSARAGGAAAARTGAAGAELAVLSDDDEEPEARRRRIDLARAGVVLSDDDNEDVDAMDVDDAAEPAAPSLSGRAAMFYASNPMLQALLSKTMSDRAAAPVPLKRRKNARLPTAEEDAMELDEDEDDEYDPMGVHADEDDTLAVLDRTLEKELVSRKRRRGDAGESIAYAGGASGAGAAPAKKGARKESKREKEKAESKAKHAKLLRASAGTGAAGYGGDNGDDDEDVDPALDPRLQEAARTSRLAASDSEDSYDDDSDDDDDASVAGSQDGYASDSMLQDVDLDSATGPPPNALTTPHALELATMVKQNKHAMVDASFNRYAHGDDADLPAWFADDERKFNKPVMPISKEAIEAIEQRRRALDARPIKKVAEAKFRKKKRAMAKTEKQMKHAASIADSEDMTEAAKARAVTKVLAKKIAKVDNKPKVVVARGANRALKGRPTGIKGRYKMVDPRMRKELRATKRIANKVKPKRRKQ
ncbi:Spb1 C-terminal domain-containing protein [Blastocladiella britannica]|nr:Spb1 C-terminal domain-containing protein [Blastocladiella britannica]